MINIPCRKCGSGNIRKKGRTASGAQKYHCKYCNFYGTLVTQEEKQKQKEAVTETLFYERLSQRKIARSLSVSRNRISSLIKKRNTRTRFRDYENSGKSGETAHIERLNNILRQRCPARCGKPSLSAKVGICTKNA